MCCDITAWRVRNILERIANIYLNSKQLRKKSAFGELRPIFFMQVGRLSNDNGDGNEKGKKAKGLDLQNNNFARKIHVFVAVTVVVAFKAP